METQDVQNLPHKTTESFKEGDYHQAILDISYAEWQSRDGWGYADMIDWTKENFGEEFALLILLGKYHQQVGNGGHMQYWDNGYASRHTDGCFSSHEDMELHAQMILDFEKYKLDELKNGKTVLAILRDFEVDVDTERYVEEECYDEDSGEYYYEDCENYEYGSITNHHHLDKLDDRYYEVELWMEELNEYAKKLLTA